MISRGFQSVAVAVLVRESSDFLLFTFLERYLSNLQFHSEAARP